MHDTAIGGRDGRFPTTRLSAIAAARSSDPQVRTQALDQFVSAYWKPVYKYVRLRWCKTNEDAKDLTQEFFSRLLEKQFLVNYDPSRARLRTFLRTCVDRLVANQERMTRTQKRGGGVTLQPLDFDSAEAELARIAMGPLTPEAVFDREWVRSIFTLAVQQLHRECQARGKTMQFKVFQQYELEDNLTRPTYQQLATELGIAYTDVTNYLAFARREFRRIVLETLRGVTGDEEEFRREARALLGADTNDVDFR